MHSFCNSAGCAWGDGKARRAVTLSRESPGSDRGFPETSHSRYFLLQSSEERVTFSTPPIPPCAAGFRWLNVMPRLSAQSHPPASWRWLRRNAKRQTLRILCVYVLGCWFCFFFWFIWGVDSFKTFWCPERVEMFVISYQFLLIAMA